MEFTFGFEGDRVTTTLAGTPATFDFRACRAGLGISAPAAAIVAPGPMFERAVLARAHLGGSLVNRRVFVDIRDARDWFSRQR